MKNGKASRKRAGNLPLSNQIPVLQTNEISGKPSRSRPGNPPPTSQTPSPRGEKRNKTDVTRRRAKTQQKARPQAESERSHVTASRTQRRQGQTKKQRRPGRNRQTAPPRKRQTHTGKRRDSANTLNSRENRWHRTEDRQMASPRGLAKTTKPSNGTTITTARLTERMTRHKFKRHTTGLNATETSTVTTKVLASN